MSKHAYCNVATFPDTTLAMPKPSETLWTTFGAWIKSQRESQRLTQSEASKKAGIDRQQWYRIESGKSGTRRDTAIAIGTALGLDEDDVLNRAGFGGSPAQPKRPSNIAEFLEALEQMGIDFGPTMMNRENLDRYTADDFEELIERIKADLDFMARRKR